MNSSTGGRVLAINPGKVRVGLAVSDPERIIAGGLETFLRGTGSLFDHLESLVRELGVGRILVGYPLNMDGSVGESAHEAEIFRDKLAARFGLPVLLRDERLTSVGARKAFPPGSRKDWDRVAAIFILQSYLDQIQAEAP